MGLGLQVTIRVILLSFVFQVINIMDFPFEVLFFTKKEKKNFFLLTWPAQSLMIFSSNYGKWTGFQ